MFNFLFFFFFNDTATTEIYTLSLHDALPISEPGAAGRGSTSRRAVLHASRHRTGRRSGAGVDGVPRAVPPFRRHVRLARLRRGATDAAGAAVAAARARGRRGSGKVPPAALVAGHRAVGAGASP